MMSSGGYFLRTRFGDYKLAVSLFLVERQRH